MSALLLALAPIAMKLLGMWLDRSADQKQAKKRFLQIVDQLSKKSLASSELRASYYSQLKDLEESRADAPTEP